MFVLNKIKDTVDRNSDETTYSKQEIADGLRFVVFDSEDGSEETIDLKTLFNYIVAYGVDIKGVEAVLDGDTYLLSAETDEYSIMVTVDNQTYDTVGITVTRNSAMPPKEADSQSDTEEVLVTADITVDSHSDGIVDVTDTTDINTAVTDTADTDTVTKVADTVVNDVADSTTGVSSVENSSAIAESLPVADDTVSIVEDTGEQLQTKQSETDTEPTFSQVESFDQSGISSVDYAEGVADESTKVGDTDTSESVNIFDAETKIFEGTDTNVNAESINDYIKVEGGNDMKDTGVSKEKSETTNKGKNMIKKSTKKAVDAKKDKKIIQQETAPAPSARRICKGGTTKVKFTAEDNIPRGSNSVNETASASAVQTAYQFMIECLEKIKGVLNVEYNISEDCSDKIFEIKSACKDYVYFVGDEIKVSINGDLAFDFAKKDEILKLMKDIPFRSKTGEMLNLYEICCGKPSDLTVYPPFANELASDTKNYIKILSIKD